jgi:hypothetical protein
MVYPAGRWLRSPSVGRQEDAVALLADVSFGKIR